MSWQLWQTCSGQCTDFNIHMYYGTFVFCLFFSTLYKLFSCYITWLCTERPCVDRTSGASPAGLSRKSKVTSEKRGPRGEKTSYKQISSWSRGRQPLCSWTGAGSCLQLRPKDLQGSRMPRETQQSAKQYNMNQQTRPASWTSLQVWEKSKENKSWAQRLLDLSLH